MRVEKLGSVYRLAIGKPLPEVAAQLDGKVDGATLYTATGYWQGEREDSTVVELAGLNGSQVYQLAATLAEVLEQTAVYVAGPDGAVLVYPFPRIAA